MYIYIGCRVLFRNFGKIKCFKKFGNNSVSESLLSQHFDGRSQHKWDPWHTVWGMLM